MLSSNLRNAEDLQIVAEVLNGNTSAFSTLVERYQVRIHNTVYALVGDVDESQDLAQEIFVKAFRSLHRFRGQAQFYTWLYRIAVNRCLDHLKLRQRRVFVRDDGEGFDTLLANSDLQMGEAADAKTSQGELQAVLDTALWHLSEEYRVTFVLREIDGLTYEEIAEALGCSVGTVKSRLFRARNRLQDLLHPFYRTWLEG